MDTPCPRRGAWNDPCSRNVISTQEVYDVTGTSQEVYDVTGTSQKVYDVTGTSQQSMT